ncbi:serine protein [Lentinula edodes]|uniref:Serine protein n=1 Tax=Lentinula edodes TaxID=5353 RepID=A0A1Q3DVB2_LENED|nr:serine protein [Lentinula edodes]
MACEGFNLFRWPKDKPTLILFGADEPYELNEQHLDHDLEIYAESVVLSGSTNAKGSRLGVYTNQLRVGYDKITNTVSGTLDVSGIDGTDGIIPAALIGDANSGSSGEPAGQLRVYAELADRGTLQNLSLNAMGGNGGQGASTADDKSGGEGGDGGAGGTIKAVIGGNGTIQFRLLESAMSLLDMDDGTSESVRCDLMLKIVDDFERASKRYSEQPKITGTENALANISVAIAPLVKAVSEKADFKTQWQVFHRFASWLDNRADEVQTTVQSKTSWSGGQAGAGGQGKKGRGQNGVMGKTLETPQISFLRFTPDMMRKIPIAIAHPDQCAMVLHQAKIDYFVNTTESNSKACLRLIRLRDRLSFLEDLKATDPIYVAYQEAEPRMHLVPSDSHSLGSAELSSITRLRRVAAEVDVLLRQIDSGLDFFNHTPQWVPRASYTFYEDLTESLLDNFIRTEGAWHRYESAATAQDARLRSVQEMKDSCRIQIINLNERVRRLGIDLEKAVNTIGDQDTLMRETKAALMEQIDVNKEAIRTCKITGGVEFEDLVEAATTIAFCPNPGMISVQAVGLSYKDNKRAGIKSDDGDHIKPELLLEKVVSVRGGVEKLVQGYKLSKVESGTVDMDDPGATKLIMEKNEYMDIVGKFKKALGKANLKLVEDAFQAHIDATIKRNQSILDYNASVNILVKHKERVVALQEKSSDLSDAVLAGTDPNLPGIAIMMQQLHAESLWALLEGLYMTQRALRFHSLAVDTELFPPTTSQNLSALDSATLGMVRTRLLRSYRNSIEETGRNPQQFVRIRYYLTEADLKRWKRQITMKTIIDIPPVYHETPIGDHSLAGRSNIRLDTVRFFVEGLKTTYPTVTLTLTQLGTEIIVDHRNKQNEFQHEQVRLQFQYQAGTVSLVESGTVDGNLSKNFNDPYAKIGPFASWMLEIDPRYNPGVNIKEATSAWFEFSGEFYTF